MAHDFDNLLMGIMGFAELTQTLLDPNSPANGYIRELLQVAERGLNFTRQMHQFNRGGRPSPQPTRLDEVWQADWQFRANELPTPATVQADLPADLPRVAVAAEPLRTVLRALVRNAVEASPAGAAVNVSAREVVLDLPQTGFLPADLEPGSYVEVVISDSGPGFRPEVLQRVAEEPFVTTKAGHRGLGLPTVFRILHAHGGGLGIETSARGTTARVFLPTASEARPASGATPR